MKKEDLELYVMRAEATAEGYKLGYKDCIKHIADQLSEEAKLAANKGTANPKPEGSGESGQ